MRFASTLLLALVIGCSAAPREAVPEVAIGEDGHPTDLPPISPKLVPPSRSEPEPTEPAPPPPPKRAVSLASQLANSIGMKLVLVPAGQFTMGSPPAEAERNEDETAHPVEITSPFYLGVHEVTQADYEQVMKKNPSHYGPSGGGAEMVKALDTRKFPVDSVSWKEANEFCRLLSQLPAEKSAGRVYRLPTEAEWEYSCRAGAGPQPFSQGASLSSTQANFEGALPYADAAKGPSLQRSTAVGSYAPNAYGLYDMSGNVWEWCADWYQADYYRKGPPADPIGPEMGLHRVMRGGCFLSAGSGCRSAVRGQAEPNSRSLCVGFRVVCVVK